MKKILPLLALGLAVLLVARTLTAPKNATAFNVTGFGELPVLVNGRVKPLDTVARTSLLQLQRRQAVRAHPTAPALVATPSEWLLEVAFRPEKADTFPVFYIDHPDLLALIGKTPENTRIEYTGAEKLRSIMGMLPSRHSRFSLKELQPHIADIQSQARLADKVESALRTPFQRAVLQLYGNLVHYQRVRHAFVSPERPDFLGDLLKFQDNVAAGVAAVRAKMAKQPHDEALAAAMVDISERFVIMAESTTLHVVPPQSASIAPDDWKTAGTALLDSFRTGNVNASALAYAGLAHAWRNQDAEKFNKLLELFRADLNKRMGTETIQKVAVETRFNSAQPFASARGLFILAFFLALFSWLIWADPLSRSAYWVTAVGWVAMTAGIAARMWLEGRPPVTNLYSSALFVGWGAVGLCLILEYFFRNAIAIVAASAVGFGCLQIAGHLELSGDTMEMMRAVLDSNFWLATHVVVITAGYSATFLAGFLAIVYILRGTLTRTLDKATGESLARMVYGIICFATLFSFVGTILGGIWADQSWGRFWGWDPKENGALLIVMWNAVILHARWGGMIRQRGLMNLAIGGNIITSWSWFGTNMLGVGLHSYGFTDAAFVALSSFVVSQLALILVGCIPLRFWRSFQKPEQRPTTPEHTEEPVSTR